LHAKLGNQVNFRGSYVHRRQQHWRPFFVCEEASNRKAQKPGGTVMTNCFLTGTIRGMKAQGGFSSQFFQTQFSQIKSVPYNQAVESI
jgi:hypothetical protein